MNRSVPMLVAVLVCVASLSVVAEQASRPAKPAATAMSTEVINLNSATAAQIAGLPGIGPKVAGLVVEYRQKNGPFKKIEEVMNVRGIGEKSFLRIKDRITVAAPKSDK
jgi:competence protein ComEA